MVTYAVEALLLFPRSGFPSSHFSLETVEGCGWRWSVFQPLEKWDAGEGMNGGGGAQSCDVK